jgi:hypothetical protein
MKSLPHEDALFTLAELAEAVAADLETVKNWLRRGIISRARVGGRQMPNRLFTADVVYKTALTHELVLLGLAPSVATAAAITIWTQHNVADLFKDKRTYAILVPTNDKWTAILCSQEVEGGPFYRIPTSTARTHEKIRMPTHAFAVIPITSTLIRVARKLEGVFEGAKSK